MGTMLDAFKSLTPRQVAILAGVLIGSAVAILGAYALINDSGGSGLGENQQTVSVQYGDLVKQVSTNGSLVFPIREALTFGTQGTVGDVLAEVGQQVEEGQLLVSLDAATVASLEKRSLKPGFLCEAWKITWPQPRTLTPPWSWHGPKRTWQIPNLLREMPRRRWARSKMERLQAI